MDEKQFLEAIGQMMDSKLGAMRKEVSTDMGSLREEISTDMGSLREEISGDMDLKLSDMRKEVSAEMGSLREEMKRLNGQTIMSFQKGQEQIINLLKEDYGRVAKAAASVSDYPEIKGKVLHHDEALESQNARITELEKKAI